MNKKSLYLGGGFRDHQVLYMIPIIEGICSKKKITSIIFENDISKKIYSKKIYSNFFKNFDFKSINQLQKKQNNIIIIIKTFFFSIVFFCLSFLINRKLLLNKSYTWFNNQFFHSIWDTCIINNKKKLINLS